MRLLYVTSSFPFGHGEGFLVAEVHELEARGHDVVLLPALARGPLVHEDARPLLGRTRTTPLLSRAVARSSFREARARPSSSGRALAQLRRSRSGRILAKNVAAFPKSLWAAELARELDADHIHAHWGGTSSTIAMVASELSGVPWSLTVHRWDIREDNLLRSKTESAAFVRAISADGLADLRRTVGRTSTPTLLIHMGVPLPPRPVEPSSGRRHEPLRVLVPANLLEVKGHRHLVEAVAQLRSRGVDIRVTFAGQGPLKAVIESQIAAHGLEGSFALVGQLSHAELLGRLAGGSWDTVVMPSGETPSGEKEGIPVSLLEAMSYGVAVLGTNVGGMAELLGDGSGLIVQPADPSALADALQTLASDPELRAEVGARGRARVERDFASETVVGELVAQFERAVSAGRAPPNGSISSRRSSGSGAPRRPRI
jgi:glycosyltransferase involved in cell wall biosynthesis